MAGPTSAVPLLRPAARFSFRMAWLQARDVFEHNDGIVEHHPDGHHQAAQRKDIERKALQPHQPEIDNQGDRNARSITRTWRQLPKKR